MYHSVIEVCRDHQALWQNIPGFASSVEDLENQVELLLVRSGVQSNITSGVMAQKQHRLSNLYERLIVLHGALWVYANTINNFQLMERNKVNISDLQRLSITRLELHLNSVVLDLEEHGLSLDAFGITPEYLEESIALINDGSNQATRPRMAIIERKLMTGSLELTTRTIDNLLKFRLDKLMLVFRKSQEDFYQRYKNARVVVNHRGPTAGTDPDYES